MTRTLRVLAVTGVTALALTACVAKADTSGSSTDSSGSSAGAASSLTVNSSAEGCELSATEAVSGNLTFEVSNSGSQITEFYLLAEDGLQIVGEVENIAPGASREMTVVAQPGEYFTLCKPGMIGEGIGRAGFTVTGDSVAIDESDSEQKAQAVALYAAFVKDQVSQLLPEVQKFTAAYAAGEDDAAREQFPYVRAYYERIEPVAEALGDLDPRIDYREVNAVAEGLEWTGFHRIEKDLWVPAKDALNADDKTPAWQDWAPSTTEERADYAAQLEADVQELYDYVHSDEFTTTLESQGIIGLSNGARALLDEVATGKIAGEEDWWSGTDLYDFLANVEGSKLAFSLVRDFAIAQGAEGKALAESIDTGYADLEDALAQYGSWDEGFVNYGELTDADKRELTELINALGEPLSQLTTTILE